ncbi:hypothetical protein Btru_024248 [Bulinus truncatus]|nr:hypothetical protein Btru_024248 [Bulinus truncatus]
MSDSLIPAKSCGRITSKTIQDSLMSFKAPKIKPKAWQHLPPQPDLLYTKHPPLAVQRILQMFDDACRKVGVAIMIDYVIENLDRFAVSLGIDLCHTLQQHNRLLIKYRNEGNKLDDFMESNKAYFITDLQQQQSLEPSRLSLAKNISFFDEYDDFIYDDDEEEQDDEEDENEEEEMEGEGETKNGRDGSKVFDIPSSSTVTCLLPVFREHSPKIRSGTSLSRRSSEQLAGTVAVRSTISCTRGVSKHSRQDDDEESVKNYNHSAGSTLACLSLPLMPGYSLMSPNVSEVGVEAAPPPQQPKYSAKFSQVLPYILNIELKDAVLKEALFQELVRNLCSVVSEVMESFRLISKKLFSDPSAVDIVLKNIQEDTREAEFFSLMNDLCEVARFRILTTAEQQQERILYMEDVTRRDKSNRRMLAVLTRQLDKIRNFHEDYEFAEKVELLQQLQLDRLQIEKFSDEAIRRCFAEAEKQRMAEERDLESKMETIVSEIVELSTITENTVLKNKEMETELRSEKYKLENELEACIKRYDEVMIRKMETYEFIEMNHKEEKIQLAEMEEYFVDLEKEYMSIMEERRAARSAVMTIRRTFRGTSKAVKLIQSFYRSYVVRKTIFIDDKKKAKGAKKKARAD